MQLDDALRQISDIRQQMAQSEVFRGYRSLTVGFSGLAGVAAALAQSKWIPDPAGHLEHYLGLWLGVATASLIVAGSEMWWRAHQTGSEMARESTQFAAQQFLPSMIVGAFLTLCIYRGAPHVAWMLPGLWALTYGLGVFASYRLLPRPVFWVGSFYVVCGCGCLLWGQGVHAFSPWQMAFTFGGGQLLGAVILYWTLERTDGKEEAAEVTD